MNKIQLYKDKTLKLVNVLMFEADFVNDQIDLELIVANMKKYIKDKGSMQVGPFIQCIHSSISQNGELEVKVTFMLQCSSVIENMQFPYHMEETIRIEDCMYVHYLGPEDKLKLAYDKIHLTAFEEDIDLVGDSYTIFLEQTNDRFVVDVFMPVESRQ